MIDQHGPVIDLTRTHFWHEKGDMVLAGTWIYSEDKEDTEPALVLLPRYRPPSSVKPCVVGLSSAWKYNDVKYLASAARHIGICLGFEDSMTRAHKIADIIHSHLPDLISMPPDPVEAIVVGEATLNLPSGKKTTLQLTDFEQKQQL